MNRELAIDAKQAIDKLVDFIGQQVKVFNRGGVIIGISGGLDSSVVATLSVKAVGKENVLGLIMPERDSHPSTKKHSKEFAKWLGIKTKYINITPKLKAMGCYDLFPFVGILPYKFRARFALNKHNTFLNQHGKRPFSQALLATQNRELAYSVAYYRMKHRVRMILLYRFSELNNMLVVGTGNKSESMIGYFTKYGDSATDIQPIANLYKTQVFQLATYLQIPEYIIKKQPSPDFIPGITDEFSIGLSYEELDVILDCIEAGASNEDIKQAHGINKDNVKYVRELITSSAHMRKLPLAASFN